MSLAAAQPSVAGLKTLRIFKFQISLIPRDYGYPARTAQYFSGNLPDFFRRVLLISGTYLFL
jgi:hypothetical protein